MRFQRMMRRNSEQKVEECVSRSARWLSFDGDLAVAGVADRCKDGSLACLATGLVARIFSGGLA